MKLAGPFTSQCRRLYGSSSWRASSIELPGSSCTDRRDSPRCATRPSRRLGRGSRRLCWTLTDVAPTFDAALSWLCAACGKRLATPLQIREAAARRARMRWRTGVMGALEEIASGVLSDLEFRYVRNVERPHGLPEPSRQAHRRLGARSAYLDNLYEEFGLAIELDGLASHPAETRWQDIHRDNRFAGVGIITLRYNWADVTQRPCQVAAEIASVLRQRGWSGTLRNCRSCRTAAAS
jgi:hypothetical protein